MIRNALLAKRGTPAISAIIPTLNAQQEIGTLIEALRSQTVVPDEVIVIDSSSDDATARIAAGYEGVDVRVIAREDFDHGGTRDEAFRSCRGELVLFLTQDAMPANEHCIELLVAPFADESVALSSARQLPRRCARRYEQLVREYSYPEQSNVRGAEDLESHGIRTFRASDVCALYRREPYLACGGFPVPCNTNEDMYMSAVLAREGYKVAYVADAQVYHSHDFSWRQQYTRNREIGRFLEDNKDLFAANSEIGEGAQFVRKIAGTLLREGRLFEALAFCNDCLARLLGSRVGRRSASHSERSVEDE